MSISTTKTEKKDDDEPSGKGFFGVVKWAEFCMNNVLTKKKLPMYLSYIRIIEKFADQYDYKLDIPIYDEYKKSNDNNK